MLIHRMKKRLYYDLGVVIRMSKNSARLQNAFSKCIRLNPEEEKWLLPHSYFELGKIYYKQMKKKKAEEMFEAVYNYDDFDFESFLEMRFANLLAK